MIVMCLLTDGLLAGQWAIQGHARGRQVLTGARLKHGGDVEGLQAQTQKHVRRYTQTTHAVNHPLFINTTRDQSEENEAVV